MELNLIVVGLGYMGSIHYHNLQRIKERGYDIKVSVANSYEEFKKALLNKDIDGCILALPYNLHYSYAMEALKKGKHVFVEKPISMTYYEAKKLVETAEQMEKILMAGHILRFTNTFEIVKELLNSGKIGKIQVINGRRMTNKNIKNWWKNLKRFLLLYEGIHSIDIIIYLLNKIPSATQCRLFYSHPEIKGESEFIINMYFKNQIVASFHHRMNSTYNVNEIYISGSNGELMIADFSKVFLNGEPIYNNSFNKEMKEASFKEMLEFVSAIRNNYQPKSSGKDVLESMKIIEVCYNLQSLS